MDNEDKNKIWHKATKNMKTNKIKVVCGKDWTKVPIDLEGDWVNCKECLLILEKEIKSDLNNLSKKIRKDKDDLQYLFNIGNE